MKAFLIFASILLVSCGPAWKLRKAERLIKEAELAGAKWHVDTVYQKVVIPGDKVEVKVPVQTFLTIHDTVFRQGPATLKIRHTRDSIFVQAKCDTVIKEVPVTINRTIVGPPSPSKWKWMAIGAGSVLILLIVYGLIRLVLAIKR